MEKRLTNNKDRIVNENKKNQQCATTKDTSDSYQRLFERDFYLWFICREF